MTDGELISDKSDVIPFLAVGQWSIVKPHVRMADEGWKDITFFTLDSFFVKAKKPIAATTLTRMAPFILPSSKLPPCRTRYGSK